MTTIKQAYVDALLADAAYVDVNPEMNAELAGTNNENAGKVYVSMHGTQGIADIADDVQLSITTVPNDQIVSMVNWWLELTTTVGQMSRQLGHAVAAVSERPKDCARHSANASHAARAALSNLRAAT